MYTRSTVAIALTALAAGAALGILLAPASGSDTRKKISRKGSDLRKRFTEMLEEGGDLIGQLRTEATDLADKAKDRVNTAKDRVQDAANGAVNAGRATANAGPKV